MCVLTVNLGGLQVSLHVRSDETGSGEGLPVIIRHRGAGGGQKQHLSGAQYINSFTPREVAAERHMVARPLDARHCHVARELLDGW